MDISGRPISDYRRQKTTPRPMTSEEIIRQANKLLNLKAKNQVILNQKPKEPTMTALDYRTFLQAQKDSLITRETDSILPRRSLPKKPSDIKQSGLLVNLRKTPILMNKPSLPARTPENKMFEDSKIGVFEDYTVGKLIGTGAYASVKTAVLKNDSTKYALKTYEKYRLTDPSKKKNVSREIEILKKISHPNIVKMFDVIETQKQLHLVLEYISGGSLGSYLKKQPNKRLSEEECRGLFKQLVSAIEYIHSQKVTHRDLKLENLLLQEFGAIKIIDFGFSTCFSHEKKVKIFCGTPTYMAPEIVTRKEYSGPPADIWALGVLLFVMLCGFFPFRAPTDRELFKKIEKGLFSIPNHVSTGARNLLYKILVVNPSERPTASEIIKDPWVNDMNILRGTVGEKNEYYSSIVSFM
ncbi:hypothetical protein SteCoe_15105 [Stentor coeruleus]|uniref:Protein kinase domain-containing protein n=1 Tax=Stentor coeruleus TaxID=5963 RepID=A0A1R2C4C0_9CILI|nr:hypothetical protein SteCoe_15105 [Stentor coeruleus]